MTIKEMREGLELAQLTPEGDSEAAEELARGYASDLLSDILGHAPKGGVLVTLQIHLNLIEVAAHAGLRAVIFSSGRAPDAEVVDRAAREGLALFASPADTFCVVGRLCGLGVQGRSA